MPALKGLILAAGRGSRMKALTENNPKGLVELGGKPLVDYQILALKGAGCEEIGIVTGYLAEQYASRANQSFHNPRWDQTNMVQSIRAADQWLSAHTCIISYSDIVYTDQAVTALMQADGDLVFVYDPNWRALWEARFDDPLSDCETFVKDDGNNLLEIGKIPQSLDEVKGQYTGLFKTTPAGWAQIQALLNELGDEAVDKLDMTSMLSQLIARGVKIKVCPMQGDWGEVDEESDLRLYEEWLDSGRMKL